MLKLADIKVSPSEYQRLRFVLDNEEKAGWKPTKSDIRELIHSNRHPSRELQQDAKLLDNLMAKEQ